MKSQSVPALKPANNNLPAIQINKDKLLRSIVDVICVISEQGIFQYVSPSAATLFGYPASFMTGRSFLIFIHPDDVQKTVELSQNKVHNCRLSNYENRYIRKDGSVVPVLWSGRWDETDRVYYCVARDGSEKLEIEHRLLKAQQMASVANYEYDIINQCYTYVSDTLFTIFGLDKKKHPRFTSGLFWSLIHPDDIAYVKEDLTINQTSDYSTLEFRIIKPDGNIAYVKRYRQVSRDAHGKVVRAMGTIQDTTNAKLGEIALRQREERYRFLVQNGTDLTVIIDAEGKYSFVGTNVVQQLGYQPEELMGCSPLEYIHPDDLSYVEEALTEAPRRDTFTVKPFRFKNASGEWRWIESTITNHLNHASIGGFVVNSKDVTERKNKADALVVSEQRFKALVQNGTDLIVIVDDQGNFSYISSNSSFILGYDPEEALGRSVFDFIHPDDMGSVSEELTRVLTNGASGQSLQHRFLHKDGQWVWMESKGTNHLHDSAIRGLLVNSRNIDDRVQLQKRLNRELITRQREITAAAIRAQESERSQLGLELHDNVNQILTTVKLYNEMYLTGYVQDRQLLVKATGYVQDCINEIRSISKRLSAPTLGKISLEDSIKELVSSINLTGRLEIIYVPKNLAMCQVSDDMHLAVYRIVQEGLNNIIKYSQAIIACIEITFEDQQLYLKISDNGKGFDTAAKRDGIGITNMKTRAENLQGTFQLKSAPGEGCEVTIVFPCETVCR